MKGDTGHHVFAIFALGIHEGDRIHHLHGGEIAEVSGHCSRSHIDGETIRMFGLTWPHADDLLVIPDTDGHLPLPVT